MSKISDALLELRRSGLGVASDNKKITFVTDNTGAARDFYYAHKERFESYVLGSIPSTTESLANMDFDICFDEIERFAQSGYLPGSGEVYTTLHEFSEVADVDVFVDKVGEYMKTVGDENIESALIDLIECVFDYQKDIIEEIEGLISDIAAYA